MILSDLIAIIFGKLLSKKLSDLTIKRFSGILFFIFGCMGLLDFVL